VPRLDLLPALPLRGEVRLRRGGPALGVLTGGALLRTAVVENMT